MSNEAQRSIGTKLRKTTGTPTYIMNLNSIGEFGVENSEIDVTDLDSEDNFREFIPGFKDAGEISLAGFIKSEANMEDMIELVNNQTIESFELETPLGAKYWFRAYVKSWKEGESTPDGVRNFTGALRITGKVTYSSTGVSA